MGVLYVTSFILFQNFTLVGNSRQDFEINVNRCDVSDQPYQNVHSVIDYMTENERAALFAGDLSIDMTAAFQCAVDSGAREIDLENFKYRIDGKITLPSKGILIFGNKWSIQRGPRVNNTDPLFIGDNITGIVEFSGGSLKGNVNKNRSVKAAGISINGAVDVLIRNMEISGFAVGASLQKINNLKIDGGNFIHDNLITGVSALGVKKVVLENTNITLNGDPDPKNEGLTHEIYFINSTNGIVRNNIIGNSKDPKSYALFLRHDQDAEKSGLLEEVNNWKVYGNNFIRNGFRASIDPGLKFMELRKPTKNVQVYNNRFSEGANLRFDDPVNGRSWKNVGVNSLIVSAASQYPGITLSYTSYLDECREIQTSATNALKSKVKTSYIFKYPIALNGDDIPINPIPDFGGSPSYTIIR
jgi:hypothetical protein